MSERAPVESPLARGWLRCNGLIQRARSLPLLYLLLSLDSNVVGPALFGAASGTGLGYATLVGWLMLCLLRKEMKSKAA